MNVNKLYEGATPVPKRSAAALLVGVRTCIQCSVLGQFEAGFIFEAHVADRSDSTIYAHKSLPTLLWLTCI